MMIAYQPAIAAGAANISQGWPFSPEGAAMINLYEMVTAAGEEIAASGAGELSAGAASVPAYWPIIAAYGVTPPTGAEMRVEAVAVIIPHWLSADT